MAIHYLDEHYAFVSGEISFPTEKRASLWLEIKWKRADGQLLIITFVLEGLSDRSEQATLGVHSFLCANDCAREWDQRHTVGIYDGVHSFLYHGEIEIARTGGLVRIKGFGHLADSTADSIEAIKRGTFHRIDFEEVVGVTVD